MRCQPLRRFDGRRMNTQCVCTCRACRGVLGRSALRTNKALRPAGLIEVAYASFVVGKPAGKLKYGFWKGYSVFPHAPSFLVTGPPSHGGDTLHLVSSLVNPIVWLFYASFDNNKTRIHCQKNSVDNCIPHSHGKDRHDQERQARLYRYVPLPVSGAGSDPGQ